METRICIGCGEKYEPKYWVVGATKILRGQGNCSACSQKILDEEKAKEKALELRKITDVKLYRLGESGIPPKFQASTFGSFDKGWQDKALAYCKKYAEDYPIDKRPYGYPSLYFWSARTWGVGKTHLACAIALRIFNRWNDGDKSCPRIYFVREYDLFRKIQATFNYTREEQETKDSEDKIMSRLLSCDLLVLDDVGKQITARADFVQRILFTLIDERYDKKLPIILTANVNADGLLRHMGEASLDRFFEMTGGKDVCMEGKSYRRKE